MNKNVAYYETITPWSTILPVILINLAIATIVVYIRGLEFKTYVAIAVLFVTSCYVFILYWRYTIQIDDTAIAFGYYFSGKEKILFSTIAYAEIFIYDRKNPTMRFSINALEGPPVLLERRWALGSLIKLRLNEEYLTRYKLKREKKVKQLVLVSRKPESVLSMLSEKGVPVQRKGTE
ncbi:MAG: hypothetical protein OXI94_14620 [Gemmatimonadota bacterium]|nr:hypothetical protein [Gemmatimonadota bacterium]